MKKIIGIIILILILGGVFIKYSAKATPKPEPVTQQPANTIIIKNYHFTPSPLWIKKGTTITWTNKDLAAHTVTLDDPQGLGPKSMLLNQNQSYEFKFDQNGTFNYHCDPHPYMKSIIEVTE